MLLVEQNANLAIKIAHRVYLLETGRIVASGDGRRDLEGRQHPQGLPGVLTMERFFQYFFDGLSVGAIYALLALGLVVVFRGTGHLNFAQGEMAMFCTFLVWQIQDWGVPLWISVLLGMVLGFVLGAITEVVLIRPIAKRSAGAVFVITIALFLGLNSLASMIWGALPSEAMPNLFPNEPDDFVRIFGAVWRYESIGILVVALVLCGLLFAAVPEDQVRARHAGGRQQLRLGPPRRHPHRHRADGVVGDRRRHGGAERIARGRQQRRGHVER